MSTKNKIRQRLQENAPIFSDNEVFMKDVIRQIDLLPLPNNKLESFLRRYTMLERFVMRLDVVRWILVGSGGAIVIVYLLFTHYELLINAMVGFLDFL